jgi:asparagine synthase (glutamine-hydrolysing)
MRRALAVYGPDRAGSWDGGAIALGCQLARLLPEDRYDRQPLTSIDGRFVLVGDVRLDNRPELALALDISIGDLAALADVDLLLRAWIAWGKAGIPRLFGDFAFAVWDGRERCLTLVRDFPGSRPLFYHQGDGWVGFASMAKGLHALPGVPVAADKATLRRHLMLLPMRGPGSFFATISRVEPGHVTEISPDGRLHSSPWYHPPPPLPDSPDPQPYIAQVRAVFDRAVADRLRGTGSITSTLSGGLDSSLVTATAATQLALAGRRLTAYTHVPLPGVALHEPPDRLADEGDLARRLAAAHPNIDHVLVTSAQRRIGDDLDQRFYYSELPALNLCNEVWISEINRLAGARRGTVLLTAVCGNMTVSDEGIEGLNNLLYGRHLVAWARTALSLLRTGSITLKGLAFLSIRPLIPTRVENGLRRLFRRPGRVLRNFTLLRPDIMDAPSSDGPSLSEEAGRIFNGLARGRPERTLGLLWQLELQALSHKGALARYGLDIRDVMADRRLIDLCLSLPHGLYLHHGQRKGLYHLAFGDRIPSETLQNRRKGLQGADWATRLTQAKETLGQEAERACASPTAMALIDLDELSHLAATIPVPDGTDLEALALPYRYRLLRSLSVTHFLRRIEGSNH